MRFPVRLALALLALSGCDAGAPRSAATVENAVVRLPAVPGRAGAGYFTLAATADHGALLGVGSPRAGRVEMHETVTVDGMSSMRPMASVALPGGEPLVFEPGGRHLMLFDLSPALKSGDTIALTFRFATAPPVTVEAGVRAAGEDHGGH